MVPAILKSRDITPSAKAAALLHLCMSLNQPVLLVGVVSGLLAALLAPALVPMLLTFFLLTLAWVLLCATTFLRAGHNFIRHGEMSPLHFAWCCCASSVVRPRCWRVRSASMPERR